MTVYGSVLDLIGNTPLVDISALSPNPDVRILMKLEGQNPGGSVKDRIALAMIEAAEADGTLAPGATLTIQAGQASTGKLIKDLPRVPVTVDLVANGAVLLEPPSTANQFDRMAIRNESPTVLPAIVIRWRVNK